MPDERSRQPDGRASRGDMLRDVASPFQRTRSAGQPTPHPISPPGRRQAHRPPLEHQHKHLPEYARRALPTHVQTAWPLTPARIVQPRHRHSPSLVLQLSQQNRSPPSPCGARRRAPVNSRGANKRRGLQWPPASPLSARAWRTAWACWSACTRSLGRRARVPAAIRCTTVSTAGNRSGSSAPGDTRLGTRAPAIFCQGLAPGA